MERYWERTIPFIKIDNKDIMNLIEDIEHIDDITAIETIKVGCRTSNYIIKGNNKYLLKLCYIDNKNSNSEKKILEVIEDKVPVQKIYKKSKLPWNENIEYTIYDYIDGESIARYVSKGKEISEEIIKSVALTLANIHKYRFNCIGFLDDNLHIKNKMPSVCSWYEMSIGKNAKRRLGTDLVNKIQQFVKNNEEMLNELDEDPRLVHGDFQGNNILIKNQLVVGVIDWEFTMAGHPLADIGQFFRYDKYFNSKLINVFEKEYNKLSEYKLPEDWYKIAKIRDLINLIQLMNVKDYMPIKHKQIKGIIKNTIDLYL